MKRFLLLTFIVLCAGTAFPQTTYNMKIKQGSVTSYTQTTAINEISFNNTANFTCGNPVLYGGELYPAVQIRARRLPSKNHAVPVHPERNVSAQNPVQSPGRKNIYVINQTMNERNKV